jgi:hypothetical protein
MRSLSLLIRLVVPVILFSALAYLYCWRYFPLNASMLGGPGDFEPHTATTWIMARELFERGRLALWNPFIGTGMPLLGSPYFAVLDPLVILPLGIYGPIDGPKVAIVISVALAGVGQYWLGRTLGHTHLVAAVAGVIGMAAGTLVARLSSGFAFELGIQHGWIAAVIGASVRLLNAPSRHGVVITAVCLAMLFLSGTPYYLVVIVAVLSVLTAARVAVLWFKRCTRPARTRDIVSCLGAMGAAALLAILLVAVQAVPLLALSSHVAKPNDLDLLGTQPPLITLLSFAISELTFWDNGAFDASNFGWRVHYSYIGATVLAFGLLAIPAIGVRRKWDLPALWLGALLALAWASARHTFIFELWRRIPALQQFRFWCVVAAVASVLLVAVCMSGADYALRSVMSGQTEGWGPRFTWRLIEPSRSSPSLIGSGHGGTIWNISLLRLVLLALLLVQLWRAMSDPWIVNQQMWHTLPYNDAPDVVLQQLRRADQSAYYVEAADNFLPGSALTGQVRNEILYLNSPNAFRLVVPPTPGAPNGGYLVPSPKYVVAPATAPLPTGALALIDLPQGKVFRAPEGLPLAFVVDPNSVPYGEQTGRDAIRLRQVREVAVRLESANSFIVDVPPDIATTQTTLVLMQAAAPGWVVIEEGRRQSASRLGGMLSAVGIRAGGTYVFSYVPTSFLVGAGLSASGVIVLLILLFVPGEIGRRAVRHLRWARRLHQAAPPRELDDRKIAMTAR